MSGYPPPGSGYPYAPPNPNPYASAPPYVAEKPPKEPKSQYGSPSPYAPPPSVPYANPSYADPASGYGAKPPKDAYYAGAGYGDKPPKDTYYTGGSGYGEKPPKDGYYGGGSGYGDKPAKDGYYYGGGSGYGEKPGKDSYYGGGSGYGEKPGKDGYYGQQPSAPYGGGPAGYGQPYGGGYGQYGQSGFPPGTDPNVIGCFQAADSDGSGLIDDKELQMALSSYNHTFSLRTVHLLMHLFTPPGVRKIGPKEFTSVFYSLQSWRGIFEKFDRDRSGKIDSSELREALLSLGFSVSPPVLEMLVSKFDKTGGKNRAIEYDDFIECCLTVKGLTEKFKEKDTTYSGSATFTYESFMLTVLPFLFA